MKKEFRIGQTWIKVKKRRHLTDVLYGLIDNTNNHGHTVVSGAYTIIYERPLSELSLKVSEANVLIINNKILTF